MSSDDGAPTKAADTGGKYHLTSADCFIDWLAPSEDGHCFFSAVAGLSAICVGYSSSGAICVLGVWLSDGRDDSDSWRADFSGCDARRGLSGALGRLCR